MRNIGIEVRPPQKSCDDIYCPFHGTISLRGKILSGTVASSKMSNTVVVERNTPHYLPKFMRYEKRHRRINAHNPPCVDAREGDKVKVAECRPLSKTVAFVVVEKENQLSE